MESLQQLQVVGAIVLSRLQVRKLRMGGILAQTIKLRSADLGLQTRLILKATPLSTELDF